MKQQTFNRRNNLKDKILLTATILCKNTHVLISVADCCGVMQLGFNVVSFNERVFPLCWEGFSKVILGCKWGFFPKFLRNFDKSYIYIYIDIDIKSYSSFSCLNMAKGFPNSRSVTVSYNKWGRDELNTTWIFLPSSQQIKAAIIQYNISEAEGWMSHTDVHINPAGT